jgi:ankyrin repeat protein
MSKDALMEKLQQFVTIYNESLVHRLVHDGKLEEAKKLLDRNASLYRLVDIDGDTVLHIACREDRFEFVRYLMASAAKKGGFYCEDGVEPLFDPNARNHAHWTPLHCASFGFHFKICDLLLKEAPVAVNCITEPNLSSPLHFLARFQDAGEIIASGLNSDPATLSSSAFVGSYIKPANSGPSRESLMIPNPSAATVASLVPNSTILKELMEVLNDLLDAGADLSARDAKGETPLHVAANLGSAVLAEWLVLNKADVNAVSYQNQETPLHVAIRGKNPVIVELLLGANADVNATSKHGTPVEMAQQFSSVEISRLLKDHIRNSPSNIDLVSEFVLSETALPPPGIGNASSTPPSTLPYSSPQTTRQANDADLPVTTSKTSIQVQEHLLLGPSLPPSSSPIPVGSSTDSAPATTDTVMSPLQSIAATLPAIAALPLVPFKQLRRVVEAVLFSPGRTPLHEAVIQNNERTVAEILRVRPTLINSKDQQKWTPILYAAAYGHMRLMARLARSGADLTCVDSDDSGILHFLARNRKVAQFPLEIADLLDLLVLQGVNLDMTNMFGATPLHEAAARNNLVFLHSICQRGAKVDAVSKAGETPLIYAARENCVDAVNFLLHKGANVDHSGKFGTATDIARSHCNVSVLKVFLFYKANSSQIVASDSPVASIYSANAGPFGSAFHTPDSTPPTSTSSTATNSTSGYARPVPPSPGRIANNGSNNGASNAASNSGATSTSPSSTTTGMAHASNISNTSSTATSTTTTAPVMTSSGTPRSFKLRSLSQVEPFVGANSMPEPSSSPNAPGSAVISFQAATSSSHTRATQGSPPSSLKLSHGSTASRNRSKSEAPSKDHISGSPSTIRGSQDDISTDTLMEDADLSGDLSDGLPSFSSFLSPRRHLTVTVDGAVIDYNKVYGVQEPLLAVFPCSCTIQSPMAVFKEVEGFIIIWQHYIAFGHVTTTSTGGLIADTSFNWKVPFAHVTSVSLSKPMFSAAKVVIAAKADPASEATPNISVSLTRCERLEPLEKLLQYLFSQRAETDRLEVDGVPLADMVGSILYPKENADFHKHLPHVPSSETVLDHFTCYFKEEGAFASKTVFISQHRLCFGKRNFVQVLFEDIKTLKKSDTKTIIFETPTQKYTFSSIPNRDAVFSLIESLWNAQQSDNRLVLFGALGRRTMQMCELFIEKYAKVVNGPDLYVRWVLIQGYHVLDKRQQDMLRDIGVEVIWLSSKSGFLAIPEMLQYMRKVTLLYLDFDPKFLEVSEMILRHCSPKQLKQVMLISLSLGDVSSYMAESIALLQDRIKETEIGFVFVQSHPAFMQMLEDEFIDIKRDWRFRLPWPGTSPKLAWIDMRDVVDVAVKIASSKDLEAYNDKFYYVAGPEALGCDDIAASITQLTEQEVRFIGVSMDEMKHILVQSLMDATTLGPKTSDSTQQSLSRTLSMEQYLPAIVTHDTSELVSFANNTSSSIVKSLRPKLLAFEVSKETSKESSHAACGLDFDTQQYLTVFSDLASHDLHSITSALTLDLTGKRPRTIHNFVLDHIGSFRAKGAYNFTAHQKEAATKHFSDLAISLTQTSPNKIETAQFAKIISPVFTSNAPTFATRLARVFNPHSRPSLNLIDYIKTCSTLVNGDPMDQLALSCLLFDSDKDGEIMAQDIADVGFEITTILTSVGIEYNAFSIRTILSSKGLSSYPREAPVPQPSSYSGPGISLASIDRPLRSHLAPTEFCHVLKANRNALSSIGCLSAFDPNQNEKIALKTRRSGIYIWPGHPLWETSLRLSIGISHTLQSQMTQGLSQAATLSEADCAQESEFKVSGPTEPETWTFHEYGGIVFRKIREASGISAPDYMGSLGIEITLGNLILGKLANFEEISSSGRSGSFFLRTYNSKFLVKSLPIDEANFLRKNLWRYYRHILDHPDTLLVRFFGLYRLRSSAKDAYFVIMANLFDTPLEIHEQYDLKGSTVNRYVGDKMPFWSPNIAMKDLDFHRNIHIGPRRKAQFLQQAEMDAIFMESFNICDYSLLVGFHYSDNPNIDPAASHSPMGSLVYMASSTSAPEEYITYYLCNLIDILTQFNLKKRGESAIKSIVHRKSQISAISPTPYRKRFIRFLISILQ